MTKYDRLYYVYKLLWEAGRQAQARQQKQAAAENTGQSETSATAQDASEPAHTGPVNRQSDSTPTPKELQTEAAHDHR